MLSLNHIIVLHKEVIDHVGVEFKKTMFSISWWFWSAEGGDHQIVIYDNFNNKSILVDDPWEYVELWIKRKGNNDDALFYWNQARSFYKATKLLPNTSAPLSAYYSFLNASKALLEVRNISYAEKHGVTGRKDGIASLSNEIIKFSRSYLIHCSN